MEKKVIATAAVLGLTAIILGAFGAHALKKVLTVEELVTFETGVRYQVYHALFLLFVGTTALVTDKAKKTMFWLTTAGVILFSGSIYLLATDRLMGIELKVLGPITPIGGFLLIMAWGVLFLNIIRKNA
ncbi:DUF423 domain-containing protein [Flavobacterium kingsejongi]|uniref:DUF423 domain-containing protein n=1 Tax=Flavobacterium kingsejongi TaxID=1678728 RepID=A0A2S1LMG3_9FLAO|nr:DUF423 domain-containing protein [Flavobacterium kingsejongi]AWG24950.1 hypothetical protein FK004_06760 [Flavobacterium kingsejongi]